MGATDTKGALVGDFGIHAKVVTKSDATVFGDSSRIYVGTAGNVAVRTIGGDTVTFTSVPAGTILPVMVDQVLSTGTTASNMVRYY